MENGLQSYLQLKQEMEKVGRVEIVNEAEKKKINRKKAEEIKQDKADKTIKEANK